jgi:prophage DNA circulation protein
MSYKDSFREASFRKVKFIWLGSSTEGGNNLQDDGKPKLVKDKRSKEKKKSFIVSDKKKRFSLDGFVKGLNYHIDRDHLISALEKDGPGELIHPLFGSIRVVVENWSLKEGLSEGMGIANFTISFCEHGKVFIPKDKDDSNEKLKANAKKSRDLAEAEFANKFSVKGKPQFVKDSALSTFEKIQKKTLEGISQVKTQSVAAAESVFTIRKGMASARDLIESPLDLAKNLNGSHDLMRTVSLNPKDLFSAYKKNKDYKKQLTTVLPTTTSRTTEKLNQDSFVKLTNTMNASHKSELIIEALESDQFESKEELMQERNDLIAEIDEILLDTSNDELFIALNSVKTQVIKLVPGDKGSVQNTKKVITSKPTNSLSLAFDLFQSPEKESEITAKNKITNPLMILALTELEVSSE